MEHQKFNIGAAVLTIIITTVIVGGTVHYLQPVPHKSFIEYLQTKDQFINSDLKKNPDELGLKEIAKIPEACEGADYACGVDTVILSKDLLHSGNQEFYLEQQLLSGDYAYYGPFTDNLQRLVDESKIIGSLNRVN